MSGFVLAWREEKAFRQILFCALAAFGLALFFAASLEEFFLLVMPAAICVIVELLNTAIENVVDLASPDWHQLAKKAKDTASAAQFCSQSLLLLVWLAWLGKRLF